MAIPKYFLVIRSNTSAQPVLVCGDLLSYTYTCTYVTGSAKTSLVRTRI